MKAMISSTAYDLPEHRHMVLDACLRLGIQPIMMEHLPGQDQSARDVSIGMVKDADVYLGVFAYAYGSSPDSDVRSYTEIEFDEAVRLGLEIILFFPDEDVPWPPRSVDKGEKADKMDRLKEKGAKGRIVPRFKSPEDLRGLVIHALGEFLRRRTPSGEKSVPSFHPLGSIPQAPGPYVAHPYVLLQTKSVIGRQTELKLLTDWITKSEQVPKGTHIFSVVAIGGMGKSALTWKWFQDIAPNELPNLAGRMWWSFYESDAHWENFIIRALAYVAGMSEIDVRKLTPPDREERLLRLLDEWPFLIVVDGLERILLAYARVDAAHMPDDELDHQTATLTNGVTRLPNDLSEDCIDRHRLRQCTDLRAGAFLRKLAQVRASRILISTRLYPAELQTQTGQPLPGCHPLFLPGLTDDDALALWHGFIGGERSGTSDQLLPLFQTFGNYPLLIRALAGEVARYRPAPGDFDRWRKGHPDFNPAAVPLKNVKTHVLEYALYGLGEAQRRTLHIIAAFRMPATWDALRALLIGKGKRRTCRDDIALDNVLTDLENRGLIGWDKKTNRYDLHPVVRLVVWSKLKSTSRHRIWMLMFDHFETITPATLEGVTSIDDLGPIIELYCILVKLHRHKEAHILFRDRLEEVTLHTLNAAQLRIDLLRALFLDSQLLRLHAQVEYDAVFILNALAMSLTRTGGLEQAIRTYAAAHELLNARGKSVNLSTLLTNWTSALIPAGKLYLADAVSQRAIAIANIVDDSFADAVGVSQQALMKATIGSYDESERLIFAAWDWFRRRNNGTYMGVTCSYSAQVLIWRGEFGEALRQVTLAASGLTHSGSERLSIAIARLHGQAVLGVGELTTAQELLHYALTRARENSLVDDELPALTALAELHRQRKEYAAARESLEEVWAPAERGSYPLRHADACNVLAQIERDLGNTSEAIKAATSAYRLAWCDGPPYAYHYGLTNARKHLQELGTTELQLPTFDESKFLPLPNIELV